MEAVVDIATNPRDLPFDVQPQSTTDPLDTRLRTWLLWDDRNWTSCWKTGRPPPPNLIEMNHVLVIFNKSAPKRNEFLVSFRVIMLTDRRTDPIRSFDTSRWISAPLQAHVELASPHLLLLLPHLLSRSSDPTHSGSAQTSCYKQKSYLVVLTVIVPRWISRLTKCGMMFVPHFRWWNLLWWFDADLGIPFPWREDNHLIQKLINTCNQVFTVSCFICHITEQLEGNKDVKSDKFDVYEMRVKPFWGAGNLHHPPWAWRLLCRSHCRT